MGVVGEVAAPPAERTGAASAEVAAAAAPAAALDLRVGYLVNQYPKTSHSFVRREIAAMERAGCTVERVSMRRSTDELVDPEDFSEQLKTHVLIERGAMALVATASAAAIRGPRRWLRGLRAAWRLGGRDPGARVRHLIYFVEACACRRWFEQQRVEHVHAHFGTNSATVAMLCRELGGPSYSFTVHGPEEFDRPQALSLGDKVAAAAFTVAISDYGRSQLLRWVGPGHWHKVIVARCGLDARYLDAEPPPLPAAPRLLCVARLAEQKGLAVLIDAAARLRDDGRVFELVIVGDGSMRAELQQQIERLQLADRVEIRGWLDGAGVQRQLAEARALVLSSFAEGLPVVLMEAMAMARPVVATTIAGIPELVRPRENGWLVTPGRADLLAQALGEVLDAPTELLRQLGAAGRRRVREQHSAATEADHILTEITRVVAATPSR